MVKWIEKFLGIQRHELRIRLYIHHLYKNEHCEEFWEKTLEIQKSEFLPTIYKPTIHQVKKNPDYKGCVRIEARKLLPWLKVLEWQRCYANVTLEQTRP